MKAIYKYKWIDFIKEADTGKTYVYKINTKQGICIGHINWYAPFRKYVFSPGPDTVFDKNCLADIIDFIEVLYEYRRTGLTDNERKTR